jgi:type IV pilus assembly protein PilY1
MPTTSTHIVPSRKLWAFAMLCAVFLAPAARAVTFPANSLIIPTSSVFQDPCGMVSTYGLVYQVLRANDGWRKAPKTTGNFKAPITVHWVYSSTKASPNRCVPTDLNKIFDARSGTATQIATTTVPAGGPATGDSNWNDGCDFKITNTAGAIVKLVNNGSTASTSDTNITTIDTTTTLGSVLAFPNFKPVTIKHTTTGATDNVSVVQYSGGAFVISSSDADAFLDLLSGTAIVNDSANNAIDFSAFKSNTKSGACTATASGGKAVFTQTGTNANNAVANSHMVNIHRAQTSFDADDNARMNASPPKIGLLQSVDHDYADEGGIGILHKDCRGGTSGCSGSTTDPVLGGPIVGTPTGIKGTQLKFYLSSAGLDFPQAGGCPAGSYNATDYIDQTVYPTNGSGATDKVNGPFSGAMCPNGQGVPGQIYDNLDVIDLANDSKNGNLITGTDANGKPNYSVIWAPHFEGRPWKVKGNSKVTSNSGCDTQCITDAQKTLQAFLDDTAHKRGFLGECATVGFLEGAVNKGEATTYNTSCSPGYKNNDPNGTNGSDITSGCSPNERYISIFGTQSLTCQKNASGACATPGTATATAPVGLLHAINPGSDVGVRLDNCTDPSTAAGVSCVHYASPTSAFSQIGDYRWWSYTGGVENYTTSSTAVYTPGAQRLLYTVDNLNKSTIKTNPASMAASDNVTLIQRGNDKNKAQMVYLAGHNYTPDVAGTRVALNTLMALGLVVSSVETAFVGPTILNDSVVVASYDRITSTGVPPTYITFDPSAPSLWTFPYHTGHLRVHSLSSLNSSAGNTVNFDNSGSLSFTAKLAAPSARRIFTYLGGFVTATDALLPVSSQKQFGKGVGQVGWTPVKFDQSSLNSPFLDKYHIGPVPIPNTTPQAFFNYPGMIPTQDGVSDLQEALEVGITSADIGSDNGATTAEQNAIVAKFQIADDTTVSPTAPGSIANAKWIIQMVRGYCYSTAPTSNFTPTSGSACTQTTNGGGNNAAELGAIVHSQPAVIPASPLIDDLPTGSHRPTVIYVGALDGQLHAFYMPSDGADSSYTGPKNALTNVNPAAIPTDSTSSTLTSVSGLTGGEELWSFIPPGQLPLLKSNDAQVDSSPAVTDVFGDFDGSGIRTWHTVLVASAGGSNREIFALDVTNPLRPTLLWDIQSSFLQPKLPYAPQVLTADDTGLTTGINANAQAFTWQNRCRVGDTGCASAQYTLPPGIDAGLTRSGLYNYTHLGASQSITVGVIRRNNAPIFAAFVATNDSVAQGIYVFGIDLVTGQKLWEWNNPFDKESYGPDAAAANQLLNKYKGVGNTAPAGVAVVSRSLDDQVNSVYAGDDEGSLWELNAEDGVNNTGYAAATTAVPPGIDCTGDKLGACNFPLSQAYGYALFTPADIPQPISTAPTIFTIRSDVPTNGVFRKYMGQTLLAYGTAGTDTVAAFTSPVVSGAIHVLPISISARDLPSDLTGAQSSTRRPHADAKGVGYEVGHDKDGSTGALGFPQALDSGNRVSGALSVDANGRLFFGTTTGTVSDLDNRGVLNGNIYQINTGATSAATGYSSIVSSVGGIGGKVAVGTVAGVSTLVVSTDRGIYVANQSAAPAPVTGNGVLATQTATQPAAGLLGWILRKAGREY